MFGAYGLRSFAFFYLFLVLGNIEYYVTRFKFYGGSLSTTCSSDFSSIFGDFY